MKSYQLFMICTAVSVLPVPGGPTMRVRPGLIPERIPSTWAGVNGTWLRLG
jgi:hypothetical protein